jgi:HK97 family phage prohead protease
MPTPMPRRRFTAGRGTASVEIRAAVPACGTGGGTGSLRGYAAVFYDPRRPAGTEYELFSDGELRVVERLDPHAFDRALRERQDVRALFNHEASQILGRTAAGTLRLSVDATGLRYEVDLPTSPPGQVVAEAVRRGDVTGSSFAFIPTREDWTEQGELVIVTVRDLDLFDVGPVTYPAYNGTSAGLGELDRSLPPPSLKKGKGTDLLAARRRLVDAYQQQYETTKLTLEKEAKRCTKPS